MLKTDYINAVIHKIKSKSARIEIETELSAHIDDRIDYFKDCGLDDETAIKKALERMGDPMTVAEKFDNLYTNPLYKTVSYVFTALYCIGLFAGAVLAVSCYANVVNLDEIETAWGICFGSVMLFICSILSLIFALKAKERMPLKALGISSLIGAILSPFSLIPCGYIVLSLLFDFIPDLISSEQFGYIYYPFKNTDCEEFLYIVMFLFGGFAIATGFLSLKFSKDYHNSVELSVRNRKKAKIYIIVLIVFSLTAVFNFSFESIITINDSVRSYMNEENDFKLAYALFEQIELPFDEADFLEKYPEYSIRPALYDKEVKEICGYYSNCVVTIPDNYTKRLENLASIGEKRCYSEYEITELDSQIKKGITMDEFFTFYEKDKAAVFLYESKNESEIVKIEFNDKNLHFHVNYTFENGILTNKEYDMI